MKITINASKEYLLKRKSPYYNCTADAEANEAIDVAVDTMNKYQKIEQLVKFYKNAGEIPVFVLEGVLKNGNDN